MPDVRVNWFQIPVTDLERAASFYEVVLGQPMGELDGPDGPMKVFMGPEGPSGTLAEDDLNPARSGVVVYLYTADIDAALGRVAGAGGEVIQERRSIGPFGFVGRFADTEGNIVALHTPLS